MNKTITFAIILGVLFPGKLLFSQSGMTESSLKLILEEDFTKIENKDLRNVVPFYQNGKWGFIGDKGEVLITAKYGSLKLATPHIEGYYNEQYKFIYKATTKEIEIIDLRKPKPYSSPPPAPSVEREKGPFPVSSSNGFTGFKMDAEKKVTHYSDIYNRSSTPMFNVSQAFKLDNKYYIVAHKKKESGIIDEQGNPLEGFNFNYKELVPLIQYRDSLLWFYFVDKEGDTGFVNKNGDMKLYKQVLSYPLTSGNKFGYEVQRSKGDDKLYGVLDLIKLEWFIKPQPKKITKISYATNQENIEQKDYKNRKHVKLYMFQFDRKTDTRIYLNTEMKEMVPR